MHVMKKWYFKKKKKPFIINTLARTRTSDQFFNFVLDGKISHSEYLYSFWNNVTETMWAASRILKKGPGVHPGFKKRMGYDPVAVEVRRGGGRVDGCMQKKKNLKNVAF